jgi:hypothetical protein
MLLLVKTELHLHQDQPSAGSISNNIRFEISVSGPVSPVFSVVPILHGLLTVEIKI